MDVPPPSDEFRHIGTATSTDFQTNANEENRFVVFAYNGQGCTSSGQITATTRQTPGTPTAVSLSEPSDDGAGRFDFRLSGVDYATGGGNPSVRYVYRIDGGSEAGIAIGDTIRAAYGAEHTIQVQVCESWPGKELCSDWSGSSAAFTPVDTSPTGLASRVEGLERVWSWTALPTGAYDAVEYSCQLGDAWNPAQGGAAGECRGDLLAPFRVRVTEAGRQYQFST